MREDKIHIIDASGKILGRLAAEIVRILQGKHQASYLPHKDEGDFVIVKNVDKIKISGRKADEKKYYHYSGYLGGLKEVSFKRIFQKNPSEVLRKAVLGMLPKNKLRAKRIKRLKFE